MSASLPIRPLSRTWRVFALLSLLPGFAMSARADTPFGTPTGLALQSGSKRDAAGKPLLYGGTSPAALANWSIGQWGAPTDLPPFARGPGEAWSAKADWGSVNWTPAGKNGAAIFKLEQDGNRLPCTTPQGASGEYDMIVAPNSEASGPYPRATPINPPSLAQLKSFTMAGTLTLTENKATPGPTACKINQADAAIGLILSDTSVQPHQLLWYSLILSFACGESPNHELTADDKFCRLNITRPTVFWYWTGGAEPHRNVQTGADPLQNYGVNDIMPSFAQRPITDHVPHDLSFDLLSRLEQIIGSGAYGLDKDLSHWKIGAANFSQADWGGLTFATTWRGFTPRWTLK